MGSCCDTTSKSEEHLADKLQSSYCQNNETKDEQKIQYVENNHVINNLITPSSLKYV